jgi:ATP-binding cassette subfamily B protein
VQARAKVYLLQELSYTGFALLIFLVEAGVVIQQAIKILAGESTAGTLVALVAFIRLVFWPVIGFGQTWMAYKMDALVFARFDNFLNLPEDHGLEQAGQLTIQDGSLAFEQVSFAFQGHEVLNNFSLQIPGGQTTALVGTSGSGKSTLVRLVLHLLKPQHGQVRVDGQDLSLANLNDFYRQVAYIPQEPPIFDGTLRENLTFDRPTDPQRLDEVIGMIGLANLVSKLPQGLETLTGERGIKLSGGERQRLAFGRVLLQDPRIVILDEPTSAMDSLTEDFLTQNMTRFLQGKTVLLVAHRLQTVRHADQIVVLEDGQIVQKGRFDQLVSVDGRFRQLWEKQIREKTAETTIP